MLICFSVQEALGGIFRKLLGLDSWRKDWVLRVGRNLFFFFLLYIPLYYLNFLFLPLFLKNFWEAQFELIPKCFQLVKITYQVFKNLWFLQQTESFTIISSNNSFSTAYQTLRAGSISYRSTTNFILQPQSGSPSASGGVIWEREVSDTDG